MSTFETHKANENMKIKELDYCLETGFAWIVFTKKEKEYKLQACLEERRCFMSQILIRRKRIIPNLDHPMTIGQTPEIWWDASDSSTVSLSGSDVTGLGDKTGNGYNLTVSIYPTKEKEYKLQACLEERQRMHNIYKYKKVIVACDDGMTCGLCADANRDAFEKFGIDFCRKFFRKEIRALGIRFQGEHV